MRLLQRVVDVREEEFPGVGYACGYFFCILAAYYVIRPLRDEMAVAGGVENLPWLFSGTLLGMLAAQPLFARLVARLPRRRFIRLTYRFFGLNLLLFLLLFQVASLQQNVWLGRVFYVWTSVFNLFVVSIFWAFLVDSFTQAQGKRLFGFIACGGTLGGVAGSALTASLAEALGPVNLLAASALLVELAIVAAGRVSRRAAGDEGRSPSGKGAARLERRELEEYRSRAFPPAASAAEGLIGGTALAGIGNVLRSPYLLGIAAYMFLFTTTATFLYFQQAGLAAQHFADRALRTVFFARIDLAVNLLTVVTQIFLTGRILRRLGIGLTLTLLPALSLVGFGALGMKPLLVVLVLFQVLRRACNYALARPARELLYSVVSREDKYKAKSFNDTFVYRAGDQIGAWVYAGLELWGRTIATASAAALVLSAIWGGLALWLGRRQARLS